MNYKGVISRETYVEVCSLNGPQYVARFDQRSQPFLIKEDLWRSAQLQYNLTNQPVILLCYIR